MDVGFYLSELLMQQGEVSLPGLGNFERLRMSSYYDENERTFYPPYHRAKFTVCTSGTDTLADYIALKKNISVASASYFVEKYVSNIKQEATISEIPVSNLGLFYTADDQLTFKPADKITDDNIFYGLEPVGIAKINGAIVEDIPVIAAEEVIEVPPAVEEPPVVIAEPPVVIAEAPVVVEPVVPVIVEEPEPAITTQPVVLDNNYQAQPIEFYNRNDETAFNYVNTETTERRSPLRIFLIVVVIVLLLDTVILGLYRYEPDTFAKIAFWQNNTKPDDSVKQKAAVPIKVADTANTDSIETAEQAKADADAKQTAPAAKEIKAEKLAPVVAVKKADQPIIKKAEQPVVKQPAVAAKPAPVTAQVTTVLDTSAVKPSDAVGTRRFEVYALTCKTMPTALRYSLKLRKNGLDPRIVTDAPGKLIHVSVGHFTTEKEARTYAIKLAEAGKVSTDIYPREIIPQKK